jgi:selenocysteine lyase/cysteine desulfurase
VWVSTGKSEADKDFGFTGTGTFLNHASVSPPCKAARDAVHQGVEAIAREDDDVVHSRQTADRARAAFAGFVEARKPNVQCFQNTSAALSAIAWGLRWKAGDEVLVSPNEFVSNVLAWQLQEPRGVKVRPMETKDELVDPDQLRRQMTPRTRVVALSAVHWATGARQDLKAIAEVVHGAGGFLVVDAAQSLGAAPHSRRRDDYDAIATNTYKWLLSVNGTAFADFSQALLDQLDLSAVGWLSVAGEPEPERLTPAGPTYRLGSGVERLLGGAPSALSNLAAIAAFGALEAQEQTAVASKVRAIAGRVMAQADQRGIRVVTPREAHAHAGLVALAVKDAPGVAAKLRGMGVRLGARGGYLRVSPHFYTTPEEVDRFFTALDQALHG